MPGETWLSQDAYERLQEEVEQLRTEGRLRMALAIEEARSHGDIRENAEYAAAKDEQGKMEARIRHLEQLLRNARVGEEVTRADVVSPGLIVTLEIGGEEETYFVASSREERHDRYEVLSTSSPIGRAVLGAAAGETVSAEAPTGALDVTVREIRAS